MPMIHRKKTAAPMRRDEHSALLKRRIQARETTPPPPHAAENVPAGEVGTAVQGLKKIQAPETPAPAGSQPYPRVEAAAPVIVQKGKYQLVAEHALKYVPGLGQPVLEIRLRISSACQELAARSDGRKIRFIFRIEVMKNTPGSRISGFSFGPWVAKDLDLQSGSIWVAEPVSAAFAPATGQVFGRLWVENAHRHEHLDLPCSVQMIVPGPEPLLN